MHVQLSFLEEQVEDDIVAVWGTLNTEQRAEVNTTLARVIAKLALATHAPAAQGKDNE